MSYPRITLLVFVITSIWSATPATAQPLGVFRWQLLPYCNVITLNVTQQNGIYTLDGTEDRCGAEATGSAAGIAFLNPNGTVGFGITTVLPGGTPIHLEAAISISSLGGTWRDSAGNNGTLVFLTGPGQGGVPRPTASNSAIPPLSITEVHLSVGAVGAAAIANGAVGSAAIATGAVGASALAANSVSGLHIVDGGVGNADLANGAVGAAAIANGAVGADAIANGAVGAAAIGNGAVGASALAANSVSGVHIVDGGVGNADLANGAVGAAAIAANSVTGGHIADGSLTGADFANGGVGPAALAANSVTGGHIVDGSVTIADVGDAPKLQPSVELPGTVVQLVHLIDTIVLEIPVVAPAAGRVLISASGSFAFDNNSTVDQGLCTLTTATIVAPPYAGVAFEGSADGFKRVPFGGTRVFSVTAGSSTTFRLVCVGQGLNLGIADPVLTALFVAGS